MQLFIPDTTTKQPIPFFDHFVQAGFPSPAESLSDKKLDLNEYIIKHPQSTFFVKVEGDSMKNAGIYPGDIVVVDRLLTPKNNNIVLAIIDGEFTVKRLQIENLGTESTVTLIPENSNYEPIIITQEMDFQIWGVITFTIHHT
jgi:DNA polymerase V